MLGIQMHLAVAAGCYAGPSSIIKPSYHLALAGFTTT